MPLAKKTSFVLGNFFIYITAIIFISSFFISPTPIYADTTTYIVSSGTDATTGTPTEFTSDDITKLNTSDDESIQSIAATDSISPPAEPPIPPFHTDVVADITENTTWIQKQSPYIVTIPVMVAEGATLTIESGVIVKFNDDSYLIVDGVINALGTSAEPIYFTSYADDSLGGDTNEDGNNTTPTADDWDGILFFNTTDPSVIFNTQMTYASRGLLFFGAHITLNNFSIVGTTGDAIALFERSVLTGDMVSIKNVLNGDALVLWEASKATIKNLNIDGVSGFNNDAIVIFDNSTISISDSLIKNIQNERSAAVAIFDASFYAVNTIFENGKGDGFLVFDGGSLTLDQSTVSQFADTGITDYSDDFSNFNNLDIKNSKIENNGTGFKFYGSNTTNSISENTIKNNTNFGVESFVDGIISLKNNYWGDASGPKHDPDNLSGLGNEIFYIPEYSQVAFAPFCKDEACIFHNPVIVVPGVMGTEISRTTDSGSEKLWLDLAHNLTDIGDEFMDPLQFNTDLTPSDANLAVGDVIGKATIAFFTYDYSDGLIKEFQNQGYVEGTDLFLFPYDWRYGVSEDNVNKLKQKIANILTQTGAEKIDVVAHSMGGLLVKKYVIENPLDNHINKAIFVGVPNTGAPKAIKALIQGDGNLLTADSEMKKISQNIPAAYDLLPSKQYFNTKGSYVKIIEQPLFAHTPQNLNFEEANSFLIDDRQLNSQALTNANNLHTAEFDNYDLRTAGIDLYAVDGCKAGTIGKVIEVRNDPVFNDPASPYYQFEQTPSYQLEETPGDGTVPLESATNLPIDEANKYYALKGEHGEMLSSEGIRQKIINIISGSTLSTQDNHNHEIITQDISKCKLNGRAISVYSPLSISIVDQDGNHSGLASDGVSIENNIPNADFEIIGEHKFVYLPTDEGQTYAIIVAGTGTGTFTFTDASIEANNITQTQVFSNISVTPTLLGHINLSSTTTLTLDTDGDGITDQTLQPTSVLDAADSQDFTPEQEKEIVDPPPNNPSASYSSGRGASYSSVILPNNIPIQSVDNVSASLPAIIAEVPAETSVSKQENIIPKVLLSAKKIKNTGPSKILSQTENLPEENNSTANVADSNTPISNTIVIVTLAGAIIILLLVKKFIKL